MNDWCDYYIILGPYLINVNEAYEIKFSYYIILGPYSINVNEAYEIKFSLNKLVLLC